MALSPGTRLGPYEILTAIGAGGMGEVYRARDPRLDRDVAVKVLLAPLASDPDRIRRFEQEARAVGRLNHPHIVAIHDVGRVPDGLPGAGAPFLVSELLEGRTLRDVMQGRALPWRTALTYAREIASGLAAAHDKGVVHRDIKPENIFVTRDGHIKILDFGLAKLRPDADVAETAMAIGRTGPGVVMGTTTYMSPEQVRGEEADHRSDIFSFGSVLYELLTGRRAFQGATGAETMGAILHVDPPEMPIDSGMPDDERDRAHRQALPREISRAAISVGARPRVQHRSVNGGRAENATRTSAAGVDYRRWRRARGRGGMDAVAASGSGAARGGRHAAAGRDAVYRWARRRVAAGLEPDRQPRGVRLGRVRD